MPKKGDQKYLITIPSWEDYQPNMRPGKRRRRRREWVAFSVDLNSDPDYLELTNTNRLCWVGLLLHAGKVGVPFELSESYARVLFGLKQSPSFEVLANQGFIEIATATRQDKTLKKQPKHDKTQKVASLPKVIAKKDSRFDDFWKVWPVRKAKDPARKKWASMKLDDLADRIIENVTYRVESDIQWRNPKFIPHAATFLNQRRWEDEMIQTADGKESVDDKWKRGAEEAAKLIMEQQ